MKPAVPWHLSPDEAEDLIDAVEVLLDASTMRPEPPTISPLESVRSRIAGASATLEWVMTRPQSERYPCGPGRFATVELERFRLLWWLDNLRAEERSLIEESP
jgi:hypothetical protein